MLDWRDWHQKLSYKFFTFTKCLLSSEAKHLRRQKGTVRRWLEESRCGQLSPGLTGKWAGHLVWQGKGGPFRLHGWGGESWAAHPVDIVGSRVRRGSDGALWDAASPAARDGPTWKEDTAWGRPAPLAPPAHCLALSLGAEVWSPPGSARAAAGWLEAPQDVQAGQVGVSVTHARLGQENTELLVLPWQSGWRQSHQNPCLQFFQF